MTKRTRSPTGRRDPKQGIRIAIDDFGTGYASLTYLQRFPKTAEVHASLCALGCDLAQGYFYSRPVPRDSIDQLLGIDSGTLVRSGQPDS